MSQPKRNFEQMTMKDLREYILAHRDDEDAIHAMAIRLRNQGKTGTFEEFLEHVKEQTLED
ncbi:hypothetical protein HUN01_34180 [Nostoc edaphicum CCNP1411]|uniref:Uncharacterized protein n=1 Tax=Nostoc edaphicum CCNP1411 TaxID=1472755 RepID=A0A7D7QBL0_9NOSO|nr:hypothetical protein [Nostoc edaphicum]QMS92395.1 hypothetical protein HUN01_34180 [Nostoc edaphicum CCNP1411]